MKYLLHIRLPVIIVNCLFGYGIIARYENVNVKNDWWETALFYQIYTRSFVDSDGDGVGDLNGVISRLEYLKELGVDAAWLSPIFKSPMYDFGYDVSDFYSIQPEYGSLEDFEQLIKKANELSIKIVMDYVPNHTGNESEWFIKSSSRDEYYSDWYIWESGHIDSRGEKQPPNNWLSVFRKSAWSYMPSRDQFYLHQFSEAEPDLNYRNPVVVEEMKNIIKYWLEKGVAGMRFGAINYIFETDKDNFGGHYPDEPISGKPGLDYIDYNYLHHVYTKDQEETYEIVSQFREVIDSISLRDNFTSFHVGAHIPVNHLLIDAINKESDARDVKYAIDQWLSYKPLGKNANWATGNHDTHRVASRFRPGLVDAFNMLVLLLPGIAMTYMGEEMGMLNGFVPWVETRDSVACNTNDPVSFIDVSRDPARTPFQWSNGKNAGFSTATKTWLPVAEGYENLNVANQRSAIRSHYQVYRTLSNLRLRPAFRLGRFESLALNQEVFAFKRWYNDDTYVVVMNFGKSYQVVNLTAFDLVFGQLEVEVSSILSSRTYSDNVMASYLDLSADEALVLRMQI
ncbi:unnamed protein product, partial [Iphiclides podalirius]